MSGWGEWPAEWLTSVERTEGPSRDRYGNPLPPPPPQTVAGCLLAPGALVDVEGHTDADTGAGTLYAPPDGTTWTSSDQIVTPPGCILPGRWKVNGTPVRWPYGWQIKLEEA